MHGLVNNAGVGMQDIGNVLVGARKKFYEVDAGTWRNAIDVNFNGPFMMAKAIAPTLVAQGWGRIVNIETSSYTMMMEGFSPYGPSKAALEAAVRYVAAEVGPKGIRVHAISPGPLATRAASGIPEFDELLDKAQSKAPTRSLVSIDDVGAATAFLALDGAKLITGDVMYIDGGYHIID